MTEGSGQNFGAVLSGKVKMVFQSVTILVILAYVNYGVHMPPSYEWWAALVRDICIWLTVAITVVSGFMYVHRAFVMLKGSTL
jgi:CDP-diacylglycerol--glycerol-3-phosphate 3-phosphatidyltransferase